MRNRFRGRRLIPGLLAAMGFACSDGGERDPRALENAMAAVLARGDALVARAERFDPQERLVNLPRNAKTGRVFRFDDHLDQARVRQEKDSVSRPGGEPVLSFEFDGSDATPMRTAGNAVQESGTLRWSFRAGDVLRAGGLSLRRDPIGEIRVRVKVERSPALLLSWSSEKATAESPANRVRGAGTRIPIQPDGEFHEYRVPASALQRKWYLSESMTTLEIVPESEEDEIELDFLRFLDKGAPYADAAVGTRFVQRGAELRKAIFAHSGVALDYDVKIPTHSPEIRVGLGILRDGEPVRFKIALRKDGESVTLLNRVSVRNSAWRDVALDLSPWAGQRVRLVFRTDSGDGNLGFWANPFLAEPPPEPFNVIVVLEDTLRADHLSFYGHHRETSPAKDRLAKAGVVFDRMFATASQTQRSCASLMTSLYPSATGLWRGQDRLSERYLTLAEILRHQGFATGAFVQNPKAGRSVGLHQGFSLHNEEVAFGADHLYGVEVEQWVYRHRDRNFFLYLHNIDPHGTYAPKAPFDRWFRELGSVPRDVERDDRLDPGFVQTPSREGRLRRYDGEILRNDHYLDRLLKRLETLGILDHTLIVFLSDHGEYMGERGYWAHRDPVFVPVTRIPLLMHLPGRIPAGVRVSTPVSLVDVAPTILELAGVDTRSLFSQGRSVANLWDEGDRVDDARLVASEELAEGGGAIAFGRFYFARDAAGRNVEGFDLAMDPNGVAPLDLDAERKTQISDFLLAIRRQGASISGTLADRGDLVNADPDYVERLRALGYAE